MARNPTLRSAHHPRSCLGQAVGEAGTVRIEIHVRSGASSTFVGGLYDTGRW